MEFFDKVRDAISDTSKVVAQKAKDVADITRLNSQISAEEIKIRDIYIVIGKRYFEEAAGEVSDAYINDFNLINESKARIQELQEQLKVVKGVFNCPNCGAEVSLNTAFCSSCGGKIEPSRQKSEPQEETSATNDSTDASVNSDIPEDAVEETNDQ